MKLKTILHTLLAGGFLAATLAMPLTPGEQETTKAKQSKLEAKAKISKAEATKIALGKVPNGTVKEAEIEKEHGRLIWSFDIATSGTPDITEVQVDAKNGKVVSVEKETPAAQAKEKQGDAKKEKTKKEKD